MRVILLLLAVLATVQLVLATAAPTSSPIIFTNAPTASPAVTASPVVPNPCSPARGLNKKACDRKIRQCAASGPMKWRGKGCRSKQFPTILGDGGCQCRGYCGYSCKGACSKDRECSWNATAAACYVRATGLAGVPITSCSPLATLAPVTGAPSVSPIAIP